MPRNMTRREMIKASSCGFASLALTGLATGNAQASAINPLYPRQPMFTPRAKRVIFLFMQGGPSHVDTFDYKPDLVASDGKEIDFRGVRHKTFGKMSKRTLLSPLWKFKQHGDSGRYVSELFPEVARHVDDLCFLHAMHTEGVAHGPATLFMHTGATNVVRPSMGAWINYGLGSDNENLPGFVSVMPAASNGGPRNYSNAFLPAVYQGTAIGRAGQRASEATIRNINSRTGKVATDKKQFDLIQAINHAQSQASGNPDDLESVIASYELAYRMQMNAPGIIDISKESQATLDMYGIGDKKTDDYGRQCLLARRMAEAGVRFIQVNYSDESTNPRWDQHNNMPEHKKHAAATDKPVAGLLQDLKQRGLLEDTLVWWGGEFGRTPFAQGNIGRDHNPRGFTVWLAGGGVKPGYAYGATDEIGHVGMEGKVHMHDLHATILHILGLDHEKLTYRYAGRDFRLTDVAGHVVHDILV